MPWGNQVCSCHLQPKRWHQPVHMIAGIAHSEAAPDQNGDAFRGPDGRVKAMGQRSLRQQAGKPRQFFTSQLRTGPGLREAAQPFLPVQTIASGPSLNRLDAHAQGTRDR